MPTAHLQVPPALPGLLALGCCCCLLSRQSLVAECGKVRVGVRCASRHAGMGRGAASPARLAGPRPHRAVGQAASVPGVETDPLEATDCLGRRQWRAGRGAGVPAPGWGPAF